MKKQTLNILHQAGIKDWLDSLKNTTKDFLKGKPSIRREDVKTLEKFKEQSQALYDMLNSLVKKLADFKLSGNWNFEGEGGKTTLENAVDHLNNFIKALNTDYEIRDEAPGEDIK